MSQTVSRRFACRARPAGRSCVTASSWRRTLVLLTPSSIVGRRPAASEIRPGIANTIARRPNRRNRGMATVHALAQASSKVSPTARGPGLIPSATNRSDLVARHAAIPVLGQVLQPGLEPVLRDLVEVKNRQRCLARPPEKKGRVKGSERLYPTGLSKAFRPG